MITSVNPSRWKIASKSARKKQRAIAVRPAPVFTINFSRSEFISGDLRKKIIYGLLGYLCFHLLIGAVMVLASFKTNYEYHQLENSIQKKLPETMNVQKLSGEMENLYQELSGRSRLMSIFIRLEKERFVASAKLAALAHTIPDKTWLTKIQGGRNNKVLTVDALYYIAPDEPFELPVNQWMEKLKQDPEFSKNLKKIELKKSAQERRGKAELQMFQIEAQWE